MLPGPDRPVAIGPTRTAVAWTRVLSPVLRFGFAVTAATIIATLVIGLTTLRSVYDASAMTAHTYSVIRLAATAGDLD
jgi:hypothetical protein